MVTWIFFRSESVRDAFIYFENILDLSIFDTPNILEKRKALEIIFYVLIMLLVEWKNRKNNFGFESKLLGKYDLDILILIIVIIFF